ncbi:hypothetical protein M422DRAFT_242955 [Sphaerobolus stellatus SS14]|nr:hypothetical protein M422DRAFT_242955 [Sphaerobolus stellatus SS14]
MSCCASETDNPFGQEEPSADLLDQINNSHFEHILADDIGAATYDELDDPYGGGGFESDVDSDFNDPPPVLESGMDIEDVILPSISGPNSLLNPNGKGVQRYSFNPFSKSTKMWKTTHKIPYEETKAEIQKNLGGIDTYPFCNIQEWGLAKWLGTSGLPQTQIDNFLNLPWVKDRDVFAPTFKSAKQLISWIEQLPAQGAPAWKGAWITLPEAPKDPQLLLY